MDDQRHTDYRQFLPGWSDDDQRGAEDAAANKVAEAEVERYENLRKSFIKPVDFGAEPKKRLSQLGDPAKAEGSDAPSSEAEPPQKPGPWPLSLGAAVSFDIAGAHPPARDMEKAEVAEV